MTLSIIVACDNNGLIGRDNTLPWHLPSDLKYFKEMTMNRDIIMGRKTFESIGRPLPNRRNIVISKNGFSAQGVEVFSTLEDSLNKVDNAFLIGGASLYEYALEKELVDYIYLTKIKYDFGNGDAFFYFNQHNWKLISELNIRAFENNNYDHSFCVYKKIKA